MAWMACRSCLTRFAVGLLRCPQCSAVSELYAVPEEVVEAEQEAAVPKISVEGGPSNALGQPLEDEAAPADEIVHDESPAVAEEPEPGVESTAEPEPEREPETAAEPKAEPESSAKPEPASAEPTKPAAASATKAAKKTTKTAASPKA